MIHWLELLSTHSPLGLCSTVVWVVAHAFVVVTGVSFSVSLEKQQQTFLA